jgi:hypothetical protein
LEAIEDKLISSGAGIYFVQDHRSRSGRYPPSSFAKTQAEFGVFPVEKKSFIEQAGIFETRARNEHTGAIQRMKPFVWMRLSGVAAIPDPQVHLRSGPCFNL